MSKKVRMVLSPATAAPEAGAKSTSLMQMVFHLRRSKNKLLSLLLSANGLGKIKEKNKTVLTKPCHVVNSKITFGHGQAIKQ